MLPMKGPVAVEVYTTVEPIELYEQSAHDKSLVARSIARTAL